MNGIVKFANRPAGRLRHRYGTAGLGAHIADQTGLIRATLRRCALFADWQDEPFNALCAAAELWRFGEGEKLMVTGEASKGAWIPAQGSVLCGRNLPDGRVLVTGIMRAGWLFGYVPAWDGEINPYDHTARTNMTAVLIPRAAFLTLVGGDESRHRAFTSMLCRQIRQDIEATRLRTLDSLRCRLAKFLAYLSRNTAHTSFDEPGTVDPVTADATQDELAAMIGSSRQTVNRLMRRFERDGIVVRVGKRVKVVDFARLLEVMEENEPIPDIWRDELLAWHERLAGGAAAENRKKTG
jgi:CRP-like cAMP-binding protein